MRPLDIIACSHKKGWKFEPYFVTETNSRHLTVGYSLTDTGRLKMGQLVKLVENKLKSLTVKLGRTLIKRKQRSIKNENKTRNLKTRASDSSQSSFDSSKINSGDLPGISAGLDFVCYSSVPCGNNCNRPCLRSSVPKAFKDKELFVRVGVKNDPWEDVQPSNEDLDEIQPDLLGQCVLSDMDVLIVLKTSDISIKQWAKVKAFVKSLWFLLSGQDTNVHNSNTGVSLLLAGSELKLLATENIREFENSGPSTNGHALPLLEDMLLEYHDATSVRHVIAIGAQFDLELWQHTLFAENIQLLGIDIEKDASSFDITRAKSQASSFFKVSSLEEMTAAGQIIVNRLCEEPEPSVEIQKVITPVVMPNPLFIRPEKCATPMEIQLVYGEAVSLLDLEIFIQKESHYFDGVIHAPISVESLMSAMKENKDGDQYVLSVTTAHQYVLLVIGASDEDQEIIEDYEFTSKKDEGKFVYKVFAENDFSTESVHLVREEICEFEEPLEETTFPEEFAPQKLCPVSPDIFVEEIPPTGLEVDFCPKKMKLVIVVDTTYNMWRQMNYGEDLKAVLNNLAAAYFPTEDNDTAGDDERKPITIVTYGSKKDNIFEDQYKVASVSEMAEFTANLKPSKLQKRKREQPMITIGKYLQASRVKRANRRKMKVLLLATGQDELDVKYTKNVAHQLQRQRIPLVAVKVKTEGASFDSIGYGQEIEISRSRKFISSTESIQFISDSLCQPTKPAKKVKDIPAFMCDVPMASDIMLVVDGSYSTKPAGFALIKAFLEKVVSAAKGDVNYGAIQYSDRVITEFPIRPRPTEQLIAMLEDIDYDAGWSTFTGEALAEAYKMVHSGEYGARSNSTKFIILVTDGRTKDDIEQISQTMRDNDDTIVIAVGLKRAPIEELMTIASNEHLVFYTNNFNRIWNFFATLTNQLCHTKPHPTDVPDLTTQAPTTLPELTTKLTTKLASVATATSKETPAPTESSTTTSTTTSTTEPEKETNIIFVLPTEITEEDATNLIITTPAENITVIVGSTPVVVNEPKDTVVDKLPTTLNQTVIDEADKFTTTVDLVDSIKDLVDENTVVVPVVGKNTVDAPTLLPLLLPVKVAPITTDKLVEDVTTVDLTDLPKPEELTVDLVSKPDSVFVFPNNVTTEEIEQTLIDTYHTEDLTSLPEDTHTTIIIGSTLLHPEEPITTPAEQIATLPTQEEIDLIEPLDLTKLPEVITTLVPEVDLPEIAVVPVVTQENQVVPELIDELVPTACIFPVLPAPIVVEEPVDLIVLPDFEHVDEEPLVKEKLKELKAAKTSTTQAVLTTTVVTTTPEPVDEHPIIITLPEKVTLEDVKNTLAIIPDTNHTVTVIVGQTPLIENENILDHPEDHLSEADVENVEPVTNPLELVDVIQSTIPAGVEPSNINMLNVVTQETIDLPVLFKNLTPDFNQTTIIVGDVEPEPPVPEPTELWDVQLEPTDKENIVVMIPNNVTSDDIKEFLQHGITDKKEKPSKILTFIGPKPLTLLPVSVEETIAALPTDEEIAQIEPLTTENIVETIETIKELEGDTAVYPIITPENRLEIPLIHTMLPSVEVHPHPLVAIEPVEVVSEPVVVPSFEDISSNNVVDDLTDHLPDELKTTTTTTLKATTTTAFTTRTFTTTTLAPVGPPTKPTTILVLPSDITTDQIDELVHDLPDPEAPVTIIVGDTVVADHANATDVHIEPEELDQITKDFNEKTIPDQLKNLTNEIVVPVITPTNEGELEAILSVQKPGAVNLAPVQIGDLDTPLVDILKPTVEIPQIAPKPVKNNSTIVLLPANTTVNEVPLVVDALIGAAPENVTIYIGPVKVVDEVKVDQVVAVLPDQETLDKDLEEGPDTNLTPDIVDFHEQNIVALISADDSVDELEQLPLDNMLTEIVIGDVDTSEKLDNSFEKPIKLHDIQELTDQDIVEEIIVTQEDKPRKALIIVPEETVHDDFNEIIHDIEKQTDIEIIDMIIDDKLVIENGPVEFTVIPDNIRDHPSFETKPTVNVTWMVDHEPKDTIVIPIIHRNNSVPDVIEDEVEKHPKLDMSVVYIDPPPKIIVLETVDEVKNNTDILEVIDEKIDETIKELETTTTVTVMTTQSTKPPVFIEPVQPCFVMPVSITKPEFEAVIDSLDEDLPVSVIVGNGIIALEEVPSEIVYPAKLINATTHDITLKEVVETLTEIENIDEMTVVPVVKPENSKIADYIANLKLPQPLTLEPIFVEDVEPKPLVPEEPVKVTKPVDIDEEDVDEAKKRVRRSVPVFPYNFSPNQIFNITKQLPILHPIDIYVGDEPIIENILITDLEEDDIVITNPKPLTEATLDPIIDKYDKLTTIIPIIQLPDEPLDFPLGRMGPVFPVFLPEEPTEEQVTEAVQTVVDEKLVPLENNVTFVLPSTTTEDEKKVFDEHIGTVNQNYKSCKYNTGSPVADQCEGSFLLIPVVDDVVELVDIEQQVDEVPLTPIFIGEPVCVLPPPPVVKLPTLTQFTKDIVLPPNICADFDIMLENLSRSRAKLDSTVYVFLPNIMVDYDAAVKMVSHIFELADRIKVFVYHFNQEYAISSLEELPDQMHNIYDNMIRSRTETLQKNSLKLLEKLKPSSIVLNVQGPETDDRQTNRWQKRLKKKVHCIQQRNIDLVELTTTIAELSTTPAPVTLSPQCLEACPESSFLLRDTCPVHCVPLAQQSVGCHKKTETVQLRPPRHLRDCFILGVARYEKTTCSGSCDKCNAQIDLYSGELEQTCEKCKPAGIGVRQMRLRCPDGSEPTAEYYVVEDCACNL